MNIAYFSPLNPIKSGISDFSEELIAALKRYVKLTVFVDGYSPTNLDVLSDINILPIDEYESNVIRQQFDAAIFHIGNNLRYHKKIMDMFMAYGGILELHDISLHHMVAGDTVARGACQEYLNLMSYCHGTAGGQMAERFLAGECTPPWEDAELHFTMNKHLLDRASAVIVHSDFAKQMVLGTTSPKPVCCIPLHAVDILDDPVAHRAACRRTLGIPLDTLVFGSFGYASAGKRILQTLDALKEFRRVQKEFRYYIVGKADGIDPLAHAKELGLEQNVFLTGFTELEEFKQYMGACDICLNLRYPTQGESSGSLHRMLGMGKPVIVTDIGTFREYPDEIALKVRQDGHETDDIVSALKCLTKSKQELSRRVALAWRFAKEHCSLEYNVKQYLFFFCAVQAGSWRAEYLDNLVCRLMELGLTDEEYVHHFYKQIGCVIDENDGQ